MTALVYMATNLINGKRYIGVTTKTVAVRWKNHIRQAKEKRSHLQHAIRKYGAGSFRLTTLKVCADFSEAQSDERRLIAALRPEYNKTLGGEGALGAISKYRKRVVCLDDGIVYPSMFHAAKAYGAIDSEISLTCRTGKGVVVGKHFVFFEKALSENERRAMIVERVRAAAIARRTSQRIASGRQEPRLRDSKGRSAAGPMKSARSVICLDDGEIYESATAAASAYGVAKSSLIELCLGKNTRQAVGGLRFRYVGERQ